MIGSSIIAINGINQGKGMVLILFAGLIAIAIEIVILIIYTARRS